MDDIVIARIRTWWPLLLGHVAALVVMWLGSKVGIHVDSLVVAEILGLVLSAAIWELGRRLERSENPVADAIGRWLLALGGAVGPPSYQPSRPSTQVAASSAQVRSKP